MRIAIVGTGIAGLVAAYRLHPEHTLTVFEANDYVGGHTHTIPVRRFGREYAVDTGFIVFNEQTYPCFIELLGELGVASQPTTMSFSVRCERTGLEYNGTSLNTLFAQRRNLLRPAFHRMVRDILRFYREAPAYLASGDRGLTLDAYLARGRYSSAFIDWHILPLGAAVWSTEVNRLRSFPAHYLLEFFSRHGFLQVNNRSGWRVVQGGSQRYVDALTRCFAKNIRLRCPVRSITRTASGVRIDSAAGDAEWFDAVVVATHSDQALALLSDPSAAEREILGAMRYQRNEAVLHTDARLLPRRRRAWAAWNYHLLPTATDTVAVTYNMNLLQGLQSPEPFCVSLNRGADIDPSKVIARMTYDHPRYDHSAVAAQRRWRNINGVNGTYFCGAYWGFGFHEDGVRSGLAVVDELQIRARPHTAAAMLGDSAA